MREQDTYLTSYCRYYIRKERKIKILRRITVIILSAALCAALTAAFAAGKLPRGTSHAAGRANNVLENNVIMPERNNAAAALGNLVHKDAAQAYDMAWDARPPVIFVDAGHGGIDGGCSGGTAVEKDINLEIAMQLEKRLMQEGYIVVMAREDDTYISKEDRVSAAERARADIYVSIHQNSSSYAKVSGMEVWYDGTDKQRDNEGLARLIAQAMGEATGTAQRELKKDSDFYVTVSTSMPACLIETGFLSNRAERGKLVTQEYQKQLADGIAKGIRLYLEQKEEAY